MNQRSTLAPQERSSSLTQRSGRSLSQEKESRILHWWYRITSPVEPKENASFEERELFRRGRTGSQISIALFLLIFISFPAAFSGSNSLLVVILIVDFFVLICAMILNRLRYVSIAGILVVLAFTASPTVNILTTPGGTNTSALPVFGLLVLPVMCAVSFLPPRWVFVVAAGMSSFTFYVLRVLPSTGELHQMLTVAFPGIVTPILLSQWIVAIVAFLWVNGARAALLRADRAEEIAEMEKAEIERQEQQLVISRQIEEGIQQITTTISSVVTGNDFNARVPLSQENILWRASMAINTLLARLQGFKQSQEELRRTHKFAKQLENCIREGTPVSLTEWTGTALDPIIMEYNKQASKK
jgi:hypothetical protein